MCLDSQKTFFQCRDAIHFDDVGAGLALSTSKVACAACDVMHKWQGLLPYGWSLILVQVKGNHAMPTPLQPQYNNRHGD